MKKMILLASALAFGGVVNAQTTPPPAPDATMPAPAADPTAPAAMPDASMPPAAPDASAPDASAPAPDATMPPAAPSAAAPTQGATDLPMCSKTVTDSCKQGGKSGAHKMHHKK